MQLTCTTLTQLTCNSAAGLAHRTHSAHSLRTPHARTHRTTATPLVHPPSCTRTAPGSSLFFAFLLRTYAIALVSLLSVQP